MVFAVTLHVAFVNRRSTCVYIWTGVFFFTSLLAHAPEKRVSFCFLARIRRETWPAPGLARSQFRFSFAGVCRLVHKAVRKTGLSRRLCPGDTLDRSFILAWWPNEQALTSLPTRGGKAFHGRERWVLPTPELLGDFQAFPVFSFLHL